jgi:hypothetical protein
MIFDSLEVSSRSVKKQTYNMMKKLHSIFATSCLMLLVMTGIAQDVVLIESPASLVGNYDFTNAFDATPTWGGDFAAGSITDTLVLAIDATAEDSLACETLVNGSELAGKIAVLYRGECNFSLKAFNAQQAGAIACVMINNIPGAPVGMAGGTSAAQVTIPVVMISQEDGATIRETMETDTVVMFLGNLQGVYSNNVGSYKVDMGISNSASIPSQFAQSSTDFYLPPAISVTNYGSDEAVNTIVSVVIDRDGTVLYDETSMGSNIFAGESLLYTFPVFEEASYEVGYYTVTYTTSNDLTDEYPFDNELTTSFWINDEGIYSKSTVDPVDGPQENGGIRPADFTDFEWCTSLESENASAMQITGVTFSLTTNDSTLENYSAFIKVYEWNDFIDATTVSFDDLNELTSNEIFDFDETNQDDFVTHTLSEPIELLDNQKYLTCIMVDDNDIQANASLFIATDQTIDYTISYTETFADEVFFPMLDINGNAWNPNAFGPDVVPAIITNLQLANGIADDIEKLDITPYPNPTTQLVNIPLGSQVSGTIVLNVFDMEGRLVMNEEICQKSSNMRVDVSALSSGLHTFSLTFEDDSRTSFQVMVTR